MIAGKVILNAISFDNYYLTDEGRVGGVWIRECDCGYEGRLDDRGWLGFFCPGCQMKLLNQNNPFM